MAARRLSQLDRVLSEIHSAINTLYANPPAARALPGTRGDAGSALPEPARTEAGRLMRVNHAGEIAAQALYRGQAITASNPALRTLLQQAAREESDHLAWCDSRLQELSAGKSRLNPLWYAGSFVIGALAGLAEDRWSLGFIVETENQVERHLGEHMARMPAEDTRSRDILSRMQHDEIRHGSTAKDAGAHELPPFIKWLMRGTAKLMTRTAYWL
jgi:3-demethoxyubiquinol 3-hydroxylase